MPRDFLIYGANGFVGSAIARRATEMGLHPVLAGRDSRKVGALAVELGLDHLVFRLDDTQALDSALSGVPLVLHCAGPFVHTAYPMVEACIRTRTHYTDISGEMPVYEYIASRDEAALAKGVMLLPSTGFDVVATDCLALGLKQRMPSAAHLSLAFHNDGPAGLPPGTARTAVETVPLGLRVRREGRVVRAEGKPGTRLIDFGQGPVEARAISWGDVFTAYYSTGIRNIESYIAVRRPILRNIQLLERLAPLLKSAFVRRVAKRFVSPGPTEDLIAQTRVHVWGEVAGDDGRRASARLHGPEAGVVWTSMAALSIVRRVLDGDAPPGFQTPAKAYGADLVFDVEGVTSEVEA